MHPKSKRNRAFRRLAPTVVALSMAASTGALVTSASGADVGGPTSSTVTATYDGHTIDLTDGWQGATACVVFSTSNVECFDTGAEMDAAITANAATAPASQNTACGGSLDYNYLYQNENFGGTELALQNIDGWVNLADYDFANEMSSWINDTTCDALVALDTDGGGSQLTLPADDSNTWVGDAWNDDTNSEDITTG